MFTHIVSYIHRGFRGEKQVVCILTSRQVVIIAQACTYSQQLPRIVWPGKLYVAFAYHATMYCSWTYQLIVSGCHALIEAQGLSYTVWAHSYGPTEDCSIRR